MGGYAPSVNPGGTNVWTALGHFARNGQLFQIGYSAAEVPPFAGIGREVACNL